MKFFRKNGQPFDTPYDIVKLDKKTCVVFRDDYDAEDFLDDVLEGKGYIVSANGFFNGVIING
ncbi:MAG: hypothetical protein Unbinned200contig1000_58 [Prokaryotic dsDNA virus sp.]|jgi:hypothetical protein|nr:hypothetical protein [Flavobacteriaceae bacterium]QDP65318.1 MAG: hypothetical protein Unbinned200contig1000_58 [Prokaryotic dsDNA virus sp.]|tara:strand:+ start:2991 stop:3179 length:189 start_codon:yes stop_codon:yes gene_type:complete